MFTHDGPERPHVYAASPLNRLTEKRDDAAWIAAAQRAPDARYVPVWRAQVLLRGVEAERPEPVYLPADAVETLRDNNAWALLGQWDQAPVFALDISALEDPLTALPADGAAFHELRRGGSKVSPADQAVLAHARAMMHWRSQHKFCGVCGHVCEPISAGNVMVCTNCKTHHFPRTDPAVIMLITRGDLALLGRSPRFPKAMMYSTLAGFVEPGESLEEAVRREVHEETNILVGRVAYHSSQPWPFPASIMLGFHGEALSEAITFDPHELVDAKWFTCAELRAPTDHGFDLPPHDSIARRLIEDWLRSK